MYIDFESIRNYIKQMIKCMRIVWLYTFVVHNTYSHFDNVSIPLKHENQTKIALLKNCDKFVVSNLTNKSFLLHFSIVYSNRNN